MVVIWTLGEIIGVARRPEASVADRAPEHARGRYQGALGMMYACAAVVGSVGRDVGLPRQPDGAVDRMRLAGWARRRWPAHAGRRLAPDHVGRRCSAAS